MNDPDADYIRARTAGQAGWGGAAFSRRRDGWVRTVARLRQDPGFPSPPGRLLELGCGNGMVSALFARDGYAVDGIDLSPEAVSWAREILGAAGLSGTFRQGDVCAMGFHDTASFDAVVDGNCLHCIIGDDRQRCLAEVRRVLRPGGAFVVSSMCGEPGSDDARARHDPRLRCLMRDGRPYRALIPDHEIADEVRRAGFVVLRHDIHENPWWNHLTLLATAV